MIDTIKTIEKYPDKIFWEITNQCNLKCKNCYNSNYINLQTHSVSKDRIFKFIDNLPSKIIIGFGGGEPLLVPYFFELLQNLANKNIECHFTTNGLLLNESIAKKLKDSKIAKVTVSIDGLKNNHEYLRGNQTFDASINAIKLLVDQGINVYIGMTITKLNFNDIYSIAKLGKELGVSVVSYFRYIPDDNRVSVLNHDKYSLYKVAKILLETKNNLVDKNFNIYYERLATFTFLLDDKEITNTICRAINGLSNIDYLGNFYICPYLRKNTGNIWEDEISQIFQNTKSFLIEILNIPYECKKCKFSEICRGGCKGYSFRTFGNLYNKDICCFYDIIN